MNPERSAGGTEGEPERTRDGRSWAGPLTVDDLFAALSRPGNRYVLTYLLLEGEPVSIVDLVDYVLEVTEPPADAGRSEYGGELLNRFIETVLPELDELGLVDYDRRRQLVAETDATALTLPYLRAGLQQASLSQSERRT